MKRSLVVLILTISACSTLSAQISEHAFGFGMEVGQMNAVQISYTPFAQIQTSVFMGPIAELPDDQTLLPRDLGVTGKYFFSAGQSTGYVGITAFTAYGRTYSFGAGIPLGMQHFVSRNVAFFGHITTAMTDDNDSFTMFAGFGVTFYLE